MNHYSRNRLFSPGVCLLISCGWLLPTASAQSLPARINITIVEGEGVSTNVRQRVSQDPIVKIEDDDRQPVAGAVVVFALPVSGTSGEFFNGAKTLTLVTDKSGLAAAHGIKTNEIPGKLQIYVTASYRTLRARALISQTVAAAPGAKTTSPELRTSKSGGKWKWALLGVAAAGGAGAGVYYGTHNNGGGSSPISISTGAAVFGSPR
jgi:hypothetical protein